jgi:hypothetical protein
MAWSWSAAQFNEHVAGIVIEVTDDKSLATEHPLNAANVLSMDVQLQPCRYIG